MNPVQMRKRIMKIAYLDTFAGISGDMMVGALLHLGVSLDALREELGKLPFDDYHLTQTERSERSPVRLARNARSGVRERADGTDTTDSSRVMGTDSVARASRALGGVGSV